MLILRQQSTEGKLINLLEHFEQQTFTKTQFQKSQLRQTKMAVGLIGWLYKFYLNKKENKNNPNKTKNKNEN